MNKDLEVSESVIINQPVHMVWKGLTTPSIIKEYLFGTETVTDWKPGSKIVFKGEWDGHEYLDKGIILSNIPNEEISYSYWSGFSGLEDKPENYFTVTYKLKRISEGQTEFTWIQKGFADEKKYNHTKSGMSEFLQSIKTTIEKI